MSDPIYKTVEITGSSQDSMEDAVAKAIKRAAKTLHNLRWFEVITIRGDIENDGVMFWQITLKVGFKLDD